MNTIKINELTLAPSIDGSEFLPIESSSQTYKTSIQDIIEKSKSIITNYEQYTYNNLKVLKDSGLLDPGKLYILTDYQCIYKQPITDIVITEPYDGWLIALTAISNNEFSKQVSIYFRSDSLYVSNGGIPIVNCTYLFDDFSEYTWSDTTSKGIIIDMIDSNNNHCTYDFKHIKFRRWAVLDVKENDNYGSAEYPAAYRCYGTAEEPKRSDGRSWVGSGLDIERDYIRSIFDGSFEYTMWGQTRQHDNYVKYLHKPFKNGTRNKYIAYSEDMSEITALKEAVPGLVKFTIDTSDYVDVYTFDRDGEDISNKIYDNNISYKQKPYVLPNVVITTTSIVDDSRLAYYYNNNIIGFNSTISIHNDPSNKYVTALQKNNIRILCSIFQVIRMHRTNILNCYYTYSAGSFYNFNVDNISHNVLFGYYTGISGRVSSYNLLFGQEMCCTDSNGNTTSTIDGNYWYNDTFQDWFGYNIMAPFQYSVFYPHTNTNFIKLPYNKGVTLKGTFQDNFIENMRWGVNVEYGAIQGNYISSLYACNISASSFSSQLAHSSGLSSIYKLQGATKIPSIYDTDIKSSSSSAKVFVPRFTEEDLIKLQDRTQKKLLILYNNKPVVKYYSELFYYDPVQFVLSTDNIMIKYQKDLTARFSVTCNYDYTYTIEGNADWVSVVREGNNFTVTTTKDNISHLMRQCKIILSGANISEAPSKATITVTQERAPSELLDNLLLEDGNDINLESGGIIVL